MAPGSPGWPGIQDAGPAPDGAWGAQASLRAGCILGKQNLNAASSVIRASPQGFLEEATSLPDQVEK